MNLFQTRIYCTKFCVISFSYLRRPCHTNKSNSTLNSGILVRLCVHIVVDNIMTCVFSERGGGGGGVQRIFATNFFFGTLRNSNFFL